MRARILAATLAATVPALLAAQAPMKVGSLAIAPAKTLGQIDTDKIKGQPSRIAWAPDGTELYLEMMDGQFANRAAAKFSHHVYNVQNGEHRQVSAEPEWATGYWTAKSGQASPDDPAFKIDLKSETRAQKTVSTPMGGDLARGGGDVGTATGGDALGAAYNQQPVPVHTMLLNGEIVGEYVNSVIVPGQTFGWGPPGTKVIAYSATKSGRVVIMDQQGAKQEIQGTKDAMFPAWSPDGKYLAWLEKDGKKKYQLKISTIG